MVCSFACIQSNFDWLLESIKHIETRGLPPQESTDVTESASEKTSVMKRQSGEGASRKL